MTDELAQGVGTPEGGDPVGGEPNTPQTPAVGTEGGGRPDSVWRDAREYQRLVQDAQAKGYDPRQIIDGIRNLPPMQELQTYAPPQPPPQYGQPQGAQELDEYGQSIVAAVSQRFAPLGQTLQQLQSRFDHYETRIASERLDQEAKGTGLPAPLQRAYVAMRRSDPDADPVEVKRMLADAVEQEYQTRIQAAKQNQASLTPSINSSGPGTTVPVIEAENSHKGFEQIKALLRERVAQLKDGLSG